MKDLTEDDFIPVDVDFDAMLAWLRGQGPDPWPQKDKPMKTLCELREMVKDIHHGHDAIADVLDSLLEVIEHMVKRDRDPFLTKAFLDIHEREFLLPVRIPQVPVGATVIVRIALRQHGYFKPRRLVVPLGPKGNRVAENFSILDIRVAGKSQFETDEEIPATLFEERSTLPDSYLDTLRRGDVIELRVRNLDAHEPHDFTAVFFGVVPDDENASPSESMNDAP